jgi:hypothetical protein
MIRIKVLEGRATRGIYVLAGESILVGRGHEAAIPIDDPTVSREAAEIYWRRPWWHIKPCGMKPLTINGQGVERHQLAVGDRVELGRFTLLVEHDDDPFAPPGHDRRSADPEKTTVLPDPKAHQRLLEEARLKQNAHLAAVIGHERSAHPLVDGVELRIGWADDCELRLPGSRLFGKLAATLKQVDGVVRLEPAGRGKVKFRGKGMTTWAALKPGDTFEVADCRFKYQPGLGG